MGKTMKILLTNDDGYNAPGIMALYEALSASHDVILIAPDREKSAVGHAITLNAPVRIDTIDLGEGKKGFAVAGTPADCIKLGLFELFTSPPDLVVSGINPGCNIGIDINYSGTASAAREGALNGLPSLAVSIKSGENMDFSSMARFTVDMVNRVKANGLPRGTFLNINAPSGPFKEISGVKITRQAQSNLSTRFEKRFDPKTRPYFWYGSTEPAGDKPDTDVYALSQNCISITPIQCDATDHETRAELENFKMPLV